MYFTHFAMLAVIVQNVAAEATRGQLLSRSALEKVILGRQIHFCKSVPVESCSLSCGAGYALCVKWPNCYNPTQGQVCCSNGQYCDAGTFCTDAGCCPNGTPLEQCGAARTLSILAPTFSVVAPTRSIFPIGESASTGSASTSRTRTASGSQITGTSSSDDKTSMTMTSASSTSTSRVAAVTTSRTVSNFVASTSVPAAAAPTVGLGSALQAVLGGAALLLAL